MPKEDNVTDLFQTEQIQKYYKKKCELAEAFGAEKTIAEKDMKDLVMFEIAIAQVYCHIYIFENTWEGWKRWELMYLLD